MLYALPSSEVGERLRQSENKYAESTDYEIVCRAQHGEEPAAEYILYKYRNLVRSRVRSFFLAGAEKEDLLQVGMIGLWQAIVDFQTERAISFPAFARVCVTRQIISAVKTATRLKQAPLNASLPLESRADDGELDWNLADIIAGKSLADPEEMLLRREDTKILRGMLRRMLSDFEWRVFSAHHCGKSYGEIARDLNCNTKSVDNALVRIKRKVAMVPVGNADLSCVV